MRTAVSIVMVVGLMIIGIATIFWPKRSTSPETKPKPRLLWVFEAPHPGSVVATPCVTPDAIFLAAIHFQGTHSSGAVYSLDPKSGKPRWVFDRDGSMLPSVSSPCLVDGKLFVGEGMHGHFACRMQCLESATGKPRWSFQTTDHIEGGPVAMDGTLFFPAGNDGLYAIDLEAGAPRWNFRADLHLDTSPVLRNGRVFIGSGKSRRFNSYQVVCLDAKSGNPIWRTPVDLPAWGSPLLVGNRILVGLGNGRLNESVPRPERPAGALACFDIASGKNLWTFLTGDSVFGQPAVVGNRIVLGSRDGNLYAVSAEGQELYRVPMGGPVVASVVDSGGLVFAVSVAGRIVCLDTADGREIWRHELARTGVQPAVFAAPVVVGNRVYIAAEMTSGDKGIVTLFCFELPNRDGGAP